MSTHKNTSKNTNQSRACRRPAAGRGAQDHYRRRQPRLSRPLSRRDRPSGIVGRRIKFVKGAFVTHDDNQEIPPDDEFIALCDQTLVGWLRFHGENEPPTQIMGCGLRTLSCPRARHSATSIRTVGDRAQRRARGPLAACQLPHRAKHPHVGAVHLRDHVTNRTTRRRHSAAPLPTHVRHAPGRDAHRATARRRLSAPRLARRLGGHADVRGGRAPSRRRRGQARRTHGRLARRQDPF